MVNDKNLGKLPPQNLEAESAVLGAVLVNKEAMDKIADILIAEDFYSQANQAIFRAILRLYEKRSPIDLVTLTNELEGVKELDMIGGAGYLADLVNSVPTALHVIHYGEIVKQKSVLRRILTAGQKIAELGYDEDKEIQMIMDEAESALFNVSRQMVSDNFLPIADILAASFDRIDRLHREKGLLRGVTSGFRELDNKLSGFQPSDLIILAARPSMGKCVSGNTLIFNPRTGILQSVRQLVETKRGEVISLDKDWQFQAVKPEQFVADGVKPTYKIKTSSGREIEATLPHPFLTVTGWKHLVELNVDERIAVAKKLPFFGRQKLPSYQVKTLAYFIADGSLTQTTPRFTNTNPTIIADFKNSVLQFGSSMRVRYQDSKGTRTPSFSAVVDGEAYRESRANWSEKFRNYLSSHDQPIRQALRQVGLSVTNIYAWQNATAQPGPTVTARIGQILEDFPPPRAPSRVNPVTEFLAKHQLTGKTAAHKILPEVVFALPKNQLALFINRLFSCDGTACVMKSGPRPQGLISYCSASKILVTQLQHLLSRFGILAKVRQKNVRYQSGYRVAFELEIHGREDIVRFADEIGIFGKERQVTEAVAAVVNNRPGWTKDSLPVDVWQIIDQYRGNRSWRSLAIALGLPESHNFHPYKRHPRRETVKRFAKLFNASELYALCESDIYWDRIVSIEPAGMQQVYDLTIADNHNFVANDFVVHNTTLALNFALNAAVKAKVPVGLFSMEQSREQIVDRLLCAQAMVDGWKLRTGNLSESDFPAIGMAMGTLAEAPIYIDDSPILTPIEIRTRARRLQAENKLGLIIVDYLQLLEARRGYSDNNRVQEVSEISRSLKAIARELNVPVIALSQLSRAVESREKKMPQLSDLRESGCLVGETQIIRADTGEVLTIGQLARREIQTPIPVFTLDENYQLTSRPLSKAFSSGKKEIFELITRSGRSIKASANHPFRKIDGWHRLDRLALGDRIALPRAVEITSPQSQMSEDELVLLAHLIGDGCTVPRQPIHYTSADHRNLAAVKTAAERLFKINSRLVKQKNWWHLYLPSPYRPARGKHHPIINWFNDLGLKMARSWEKILPQALFLAPNDQVALFLRHLWATDGNISWKKLAGRLPGAAIFYSSTSRVLIQQVQHLLLRLGIQSTIRLVPNIRYRTGYQVHVQGRDEQLKFLEIVGCFGQRGQIIPKLQDALKQIITNPNTDILPQSAWAEAVEPAKVAAGMSWRTVSAAIGTAYSGSSLLKSGIGRERLMRLAVATQSSRLKALAESDVYWDEIVSIKPIGFEEVFDATVEGTHNFLANDIIVHNSIEQDADVVMFMYREDYYDKETERKGVTDILIRKHRNGPIGEVELMFKAEQARFYDIDRKKIPPKP